MEKNALSRAPFSTCQTLPHKPNLFNIFRIQALDSDLVLTNSAQSGLPTSNSTASYPPTGQGSLLSPFFEPRSGFFKASLSSMVVTKGGRLSAVLLFGGPGFQKVGKNFRKRKKVGLRWGRRCGAWWRCSLLDGTCENGFEEHGSMPVFMALWGKIGGWWELSSPPPLPTMSVDAERAPGGRGIGCSSPFRWWRSLQASCCHNKVLRYETSNQLGFSLRYKQLVCTIRSRYQHLNYYVYSPVCHMCTDSTYKGYNKPVEGDSSPSPPTPRKGTQKMIKQQTSEGLSSRDDEGGIATIKPFKGLRFSPGNMNNWMAYRINFQNH